jgi:hypothetical protein
VDADFWHRFCHRFCSHVALSSWSLMSLRYWDDDAQWLPYPRAVCPVPCSWKKGSGAYCRQRRVYI